MESKNCKKKVNLLNRKNENTNEKNKNESKEKGRIERTTISTTQFKEFFVSHGLKPSETEDTGHLIQTDLTPLDIYGILCDITENNRKVSEFIRNMAFDGNTNITGDFCFPIVVPEKGSVEIIDSGLTKLLLFPKYDTGQVTVNFVCDGNMTITKGIFGCKVINKIFHINLKGVENSIVDLVRDRFEGVFEFPEDKSYVLSIFLETASSDLYKGNSYYLDCNAYIPVESSENLSQVKTIRLSYRMEDYPPMFLNQKLQPKNRHTSSLCFMDKSGNILGDVGDISFEYE